MIWHAIDGDSALGHLGVDATRGLSHAEAAARLAQHGPNKLATKARASPLGLLLAQFKNTLIVILLVATVLSAFLGEMVDAAIILVIVLFCAVLGFVQEFRAERALDALKRMLAPMVTVLREGVETRIPSADLVPGDIMLVEAGDRISADARLIEIHSLKCDEAALTGESFPVDKSVAPVAAEAPLGDRRDIVFAGTIVSYGRGKAVITNTGMKTEFGQIAEQVSNVTPEVSPLEKRTAEIGRWLGILALGVCAVAIVVGLTRAWFGGQLDWQLLLTLTMFAIALAVAAVPEALAAIVTGALAVGMHEMAKRNALVRRMPAVETLGCTTVICSDKTGTLTKGEMTVRRIHVNGRNVEISGAGYAPTGSFEPADAANDEAMRLALTAGVLCSDAELASEGARWFIKGDPTEGALSVVAAKAGLPQQKTRLEAPRVAEIPFSSERKRMTTLHRMSDGRHLAFVKGAPEVLLERCTAQQRSEGVEPFSDAARARILAANEAMASSALRVLAVAYKPVRDGEAQDEETLERGLVFLGLIGMMDPPREEVKEAIAVCRRVHIRPVMITGDHKLTAVAVAQEIGIHREGDMVLTGDELGRMGDDEFGQIVDRVSVYARVSPMDKLKIVRAWKSRGEVVAMTGDGVNDAPSLKHADIGIAMGITGTDVAKESADMVLGDDNFATIVKAIERGRWVYDNIKKYLTYLLRANVTEVVVLGGVVIAAGPEYLPLLPAAILYVNLATDGLPALALGLSPPDRDIMLRPPRNPSESVFSKDVRTLVLLGIVIECPLLLWVWFDDFSDLETARTEMFLLLVFIELTIVMSFRSLRYSILEAPPHKWLLIAMAWEIALLAVLIQIPSVRGAFGIRMPTWTELALAAVVSIGVLLTIELSKAGLRRGALALTRPRAREITLQQARAQSALPLSAGGNAMKVLIPIDRSPNCQFAIRHIIAQFMNNTAMEIHLLNVQPPFSRYISRFFNKSTLQDYHREQADESLRPCKQLLDKLGIPYSAHQMVGHKARCITDTASRLKCDLILMSTARKNSLTRLVESSVTNEVLELTSVPVEVIAGDSMSKWERYGIPGAIAAGVLLLFAAAD